MRRTNGRRSGSASLRQRVLSVPTLASFAVAGAVITLLATQFDIDWTETWNSIRGMNPWLYALAMVLYYLSFLFRGARWRILALNAGDRADDNRRVPSTLVASQLIIIGWFVNSVTWLRLGDGYRAYAFAEESRSSFPWSLGTILAERVLDMATIAVVLVVSVVFLTTTSDLAASRFILILALVLSAGVAMIIALMRVYGPRVASFLPGRLEEAYNRFHQGTLGSFGKLPLVSLLGLVGWLLEMCRLYFVIEALGIDVGLVLIPVVALGHSILSTVPTPGGVGAVEPGITGLLLIQMSRPDAAATAIVDRSITYLSVIVIGGLLFLGRQIFQMRRLRDPVQATSDDAVLT